MGDPRIIDIELDERTIIRRNEDVEQERRIAIFDLLEGNSFARPGTKGRSGSCCGSRTTGSPSTSRTRRTEPLDTVRLGLARFRRLIRDYFAICDSYYKAVRSDTPHRIETSTWPGAPSTTRRPSSSRSAWTARSSSTSTPPGGSSP
jgi:uncharacterized protein (UPF0262 family)